MQLRRSVLIAVIASTAFIVAAIAFAITRGRKDELPSPFVSPAERAAMQEVAANQDRTVAEQARPTNEAPAQTAARLEQEDKMIDRIAGVENGNPRRRRTPRSQTSSNAIDLPPGGVAVVGERTAGTPPATEQQPSVIVAQPQVWQVPYAEGFDTGWGLPLNVSDFVQNQPVTTNGQQAQRNPQQAPNQAPQQGPSQAPPPVQETPVGGAANSPPAPGATNQQTPAPAANPQAPATPR